MSEQHCQPKIFGVGMSKTGTTTLGRCFAILGLLPHKSADRGLKNAFRKTGNYQKIIEIAKEYRSFEDTPWYLAFDRLDAAFPGSKFILTIRKDSMTHARSSWSHGVRAGRRTGEADAGYIRDKIAVYEKHNNRVLDYFKDRPDDLLVVCWENGDGWEKLCPFLGVPIPDVPIPHANKGDYRKKHSFIENIQELAVFRGLKKFKYRMKLIITELKRRFKSG
jgi:hypothetical protein